MGLDITLIALLLAAIVVLIIVIFAEAKYYPDRESIAEDEKENETLPDLPYTCMLNPIIPCLGISSSGVIIGYIDLIVWISFFAIVILIGISYFIFVVPRKYNQKAKQTRLGSIRSSKRKGS